MNDLFWRCALVPAVMIGVTLCHVHDFWCEDRSSWGAGCGFGMFATVDFHGTRFFRCHVIHDGQRYPATFEGSLVSEALGVRIAPNPSRLTELVEQLGKHNWRLITYRAQRVSDNCAARRAADAPVVRSVAVCSVEQWLERHPQAEIVDARTLAIESVELELWGLRMNVPSGRIEAFPKARVVWPAAPLTARREL